MTIITCNLPVAFIDAMQKIVDEGFFPSRSELVRVALREFVVRELASLDKFRECQAAPPATHAPPRQVRVAIGMRTIGGAQQPARVLPEQQR